MPKDLKRNDLFLKYFLFSDANAILRAFSAVHDQANSLIKRIKRFLFSVRRSSTVTDLLYVSFHSASKKGAV